ncbi:MAG: type VI secretion system baseplate subunit TssG [Pseudomonadota bacterium]
MAAHARQSHDDLTDLAAKAGRADFFALLRAIEQIDGRRFGREGGPADEPARLGQHVRLSFATTDVADMQTDPQAKVAVNVLGLLGPEGPMPLYLTRWVMARLSNRWFAGDAEGVTSDTAFKDFTDILQHRLIALYWRAWADARAEIQVSHKGGGPSVAILRALAGLGLAGDKTTAHDTAKLRHATTLAQHINHPQQLTSYLTEAIGVPVSLQEFIGQWDVIPAPLQSRLGHSFSGLGDSAVIGARSFSRQNRAELRLGPLTYAQFLALLDDPDTRDKLRHAILFAAGHGVSFQIRLVLAATEIPAARLGECRLGANAWVQPRRDQDAADLTLADVTAKRSAA